MIRCEIHAYRRKFEYQLAFSKCGRIEIWQQYRKLLPTDILMILLAGTKK
jgi:hypothetical protein